MKYDTPISMSLPVKIGIGLIALLFVLNSIFLYLFVQEKKRNKDLVRAMKETKESLNKMQEAFNKRGTEQAPLFEASSPRKPVSSARTEPPIVPAPVQEAKNVVPAVVPAPAQEPKKAAPIVPAPVQETKRTASGEQALPEKKSVPVEDTKVIPPLERTVKLNIPTNAAPLPLVYAEAGEYSLVCEKDAKALHVFRFGNGKFSLVKSYPCIIGANNGDKRKAGDFATPKGLYFILRYTPGNKLPGDYGTGAFVLSYPNLIDRKEGKRGNGIWLHGHNNNKNLNDLLNTKGCIVVANDVIKELTGIIKPQYTTITVVDRLQFSDQQGTRTLSEELKNFVNSWRHSWESINTRKYLSFYAPDFVNSEGMNYEVFRNYKEKVNSNKKSIHVRIEKVAALVSQEGESRLAVVRFDQKYQSNNFKSDNRKVLYLRKGKQGWQIIGESII